MRQHSNPAAGYYRAPALSVQWEKQGTGKAAVTRVAWRFIRTAFTSDGISSLVKKSLISTLPTGRAAEYRAAFLAIVYCGERTIPTYILRLLYSQRLLPLLLLTCSFSAGYSSCAERTVSLTQERAVRDLRIFLRPCCISTGIGFPRSLEV